MRKYRLAPLAKADLDEIWLYVARKASLKMADRLVDSITDSFPILANVPELGRKRPEIGQGVRCFAVRRYLVYYRDSRDGIVISRVIHRMRDQERALEREGD
jgi:toxin ParE1/3/4